MNALSFKRYLIEGIAGISSNLGNPSQQPYSEIPTSSEQLPSHVELGGEGPPVVTPDKEDRLKDRMQAQIMGAAYKGLSSDDVEEMKNEFKKILFLLGEPRDK